MTTGSKTALIVRGGWDGHQPVEATDSFVPFLHDNGYDVRVEDSPAIYADTAYLRTVDVIVQCMTMSSIESEQLRGLTDAVSAGTGLAGAANAGTGEIVLSLRRMTAIHEIRPDDLLAVVEPGILNADLNTELADHGLWWPPDPASRDISTVGGNIATGAGGLLCAKYGVVRDAVLGDGASVDTDNDEITAVLSQ